METTTAGDYTLELAITQSMLSYFRDHREDNNNEAHGYALKLLLIKEISNVITQEVQSMGFEENVGKLNVVDIQFCYKNSSMLKGLR